MRWLLVSAQHHPTHGGIGTYVSHAVGAAVRAGWSVELITRPGPNSPRGARIHEVTTIDMAEEFADRIDALRRLERVRPYGYALWSLAVAKRLMTLGTDFDAIEFVDCQAEGFVSLASRRVRERFRAAGVPMIVHAHTPMFMEEQVNGADATRFGRTIYHDWEQQAIATADGLITASDLLRQRLPRAKASAVLAYPIAAPAKTVAMQERSRCESIVLVGSVQPRKGVDTWARSLNLVFRTRANANAMLIGGDTPTAPGGTSMAAHVRSLIEPQFRDRFTWSGSLSHERVQAQIAGATLAVVPSMFDNSPFVVSESLACGTPVVVSDQVGWIEHVPDLPRFSAGDARALADAQLMMLADGEAARKIAEKCRKQLFDACNPDRHLAKRQAFVQSIKSNWNTMPVELPGHDAMDAMEAFIADVEDAEQSLMQCSRAGS